MYIGNIYVINPAVEIYRNRRSNLQRSTSTLWYLDTYGNLISQTLNREYMVRNKYSRLLFTCEDRLCANLRV